MIHKILIWLSVIMTLLGFLIMIIEKINNNTLMPKYVLYVMVIVGLVVSIVLTLTDISGVKKSTGVNIFGNSTIFGDVINDNKGKIIKGDITTSAKKRYEDAYIVVEEEIISNFIKLNSLISAINENNPEKFWDLRKPNESEDTYQERAKNFHKNHQSHIFQLINRIQLKTEVFSSSRTHLAFYPDVAKGINAIYSWQEKCYEDLLSYAQRLSHNIDIADSDLDIYSKNMFLRREKYANSRILFLLALKIFLDIYPGNTVSNMIYSDLNLDKEYLDINDTVQKNIHALYKEKAAILAEQMHHPERQEQIDRLVRDPYLIFLRKTLGLSDTLTEAEYRNLLQKKIDTEGKDFSSLLSSAAFSYLDSDGRAAEIYLQKALEKKDLPEKAKRFIEASLARLVQPDIFDGGIGIIILGLEAESPLQEKGIAVGDILYKVNGELIIEPSDISSLLGQTGKDEDILLDVYTIQKKFKNISIPGGTPLHCKVSQLIILKLFQL